MKHTNIVWCIHLSQLNNMHCDVQQQYIHYKKPSLKIGPHSPEAPQSVETTRHIHVAIQPSGK